MACGTLGTLSKRQVFGTLSKRLPKKTKLYYSMRFH